MRLKLIEMHGAYPLFAILGLDSSPIPGRLYDITWRRWQLEHRVVGVCEAHEGQGAFFRVPRAADLQCSEGNTGTALAAWLFTMSDASIDVTDLQLQDRLQSI